MNASTRSLADLVGRLLLALLFLLSGLGKITGYDATAGYMQAMGVPALLLPLVIALEVLGGLALILGWQTRLVAVLLAGFSLVSAALFHHDLADQIQRVMFLKNLAIAGGLLIVAVHGAGAWSIDACRRRG